MFVKVSNEATAKNLAQEINRIKGARRFIEASVGNGGDGEWTVVIDGTRLTRSLPVKPILAKKTIQLSADEIKDVDTLHDLSACIFVYTEVLSIVSKINENRDGTSVSDFKDFLMQEK